MPSLALTAMKLKDMDWATTIARDYYNNYLNNLQNTALYTKENIEFIRWFPNLIHSKDRIFYLLYHKGKKIDEMINSKGLSEQLVTSIIIKEEIADKLYRNGKPVVEQPNWNKIKTTISKKYSVISADSLVESIRFDYHTMYYKSWGKWRQYAKVIEDKIKQYPPKQGGKNLNFLGDTWGLNVAAWDVFEHCNDQLVLTKALQWIETAIQLEQPPNHQYYDTKANLLYKLGKVKEAIALEEKAIALDNEYAIKNGKEKGILVDTYYAIIDKMKKGEPTWKVGQQN